MTRHLFMTGFVMLSACATTSTAPFGMAQDRFVTFDCDGQDFQARFNADTKTIRVRSQHGAAELGPDGSDYRGDGFTLSNADGGGLSLLHEGKTLGKNCKPSA